MKPTILVVTTVHWPDDTRIRERLIRTLAPEFEIRYASKSPGPSDRSGLEYLELAGGRIRRNLEAIRLALAGPWDVLVVHDPELIPCALLARLLRHRHVVFDVHEDFVSTAFTRSWVPALLRRPLSGLMRALLRLAERSLVITLAEPGYQRLFTGPHPTFANYPDTTAYPDAGGDADGPVVYLGDVTLERGVDLAVSACSSMGAQLRLIGRVAADTRERLEKMSSLGDGLSIDGPVPNRRALETLASCSVGLAPLRDLPNYRYSQPTKVLEYLAMGLPVVASDLPGTRGLVEGLDAVVLVEPDDAVDLARGISRARDPEVASIARRQAPTVRERFSWPSAEVGAFYRSLV